MSYADPTPVPSIFSPRDQTAAADNASQSLPTLGDQAPARPLRTSQSFRVDEGYSGEETPSLYEDPNQEPRLARDSRDVRIPAWMTGLNDALREEYAYKLVRTLPTSHIASLVDRLVPILHLDFIQILPSELSLQIFSYLPPRSLLNSSLASRTWRKFAMEPRLWRDLYKAAGWEANDQEVRKFEEEMRDRAEVELRQQAEAKRKADERREEEKRMIDVAKKNLERFKSGARAAQDSSNAGTMGMDAEWRPDAEGDATEQDNSTDNTEEYHMDISHYNMAAAEASRQIRLGSASGQGLSFASASTLSDEEDMYPSPYRTSALQTYQEPPLTIQPTLTTPGYGCPRLNWAFLYKNRKRLEDNWIHNRYSTFQIPHPNYPHEGHAECIYTIQYSPKFLVSGSRDKTIRIWDTKTRRLKGKPLMGHNGSVLCLQFDESPEEDVIISGSSDSNVIVWKFSTGEVIKIIEKAHLESVLNLRFSKKWLVTCSKDKCIKIWNRQEIETTSSDYPWTSKLLFGNGKAIQNHPHHPQYQQNQATWTVQDLGASSGLGLQNPFGHSGFGMSKQPSKVTVKTLPAYTATQALIGHSAAVNAIQLHKESIVSASGDRLIKLWNLRTGVCEKTFMGHTKGIACIQFDGNTIVSGSSDQTIRVFDRDTQAETAVLQGHGALVRTVQASANRIVSGSYDETVRVWRRDEETGDWIPGAVLRQNQSSVQPSPPSMAPPPPPPPPPMPSAPVPIAAVTPAHVAMQMNALQQFQAANAATGNGNPPPIATGAVQMHQVHTVGSPGLAGAVAASHLLPMTHGTTHYNQNHHSAQPVVAAPAPAPAATAAPAPPVPASGTHRVFKLQFDARWIICCSQDSRIVGWDYAADEEGVVEASRFFKGES